MVTRVPRVLRYMQSGYEHADEGGSGCAARGLGRRPWQKMSRFLRRRGPFCRDRWTGAAVVESRSKAGPRQVESSTGQRMYACTLVQELATAGPPRAHLALIARDA